MTQMASYAGRTSRQRELEKLYNRMCYRFSRHEVWQDMVWMIACAISNAVDDRFADQREEQYMRIVKKYTKEELDVFPEFFTHIVMGMEENPDCDFLGELYMGLELGSKHTGQFFTPYSVCRMMAECSIQEDLLKEQIEKQGWISVSDVACGAGATLVAAANYLRAHKINYQMQALFVAQDIDPTVALMCYIQLSLMGCAGYVVIGDSLCAPMTGPVLFGENSSRCWYTPLFFHEVWGTRRAIEQIRMMFRAVATGPAEAADSSPIANIAEVEAAESAPEIPDSVPEPKPADEYTPTFTVSTRKKNAGQIMFDFG